MNTTPLLLLVDDAPDVGVILRRYARTAGHELVVAADAEAAFTFLQQGRRPDLVVLDLNLPGVSGLELCRRLRQTPAHAGLPIALFSHFERPQDVVEGLEAGADYVFTKDLLCAPEDWQERVGDILRPPAGRIPPAVLSMTEPSSSPHRLAAQLNQALGSPSAWQLDPGIVQFLVRRAWQRACPAPPGGRAPDTSSWLAPDGSGIDSERFAAAAAGVSLPVFVQVLAEQIWCLLGTSASAAFWAAVMPPPTRQHPTNNA